MAGFLVFLNYHHKVQFPSIFPPLLLQLRSVMFCRTLFRKSNSLSVPLNVSDPNTKLKVQQLDVAELYKRYLTMKFGASRVRKPLKDIEQAKASAVAGTRDKYRKIPIAPSPVALFLAENKGNPVFRELHARGCSPLAAWAKLPEKEKQMWIAKAKNHVGFPERLPSIPKPKPANRGVTAYQVFCAELMRDPRFLALDMSARRRFRLLSTLWLRQKQKIREAQAKLIESGALAAPEQKVAGPRVKTFAELGLKHLESKNAHAAKQRQQRAAKPSPRRGGKTKK